MNRKQNKRMNDYLFTELCSLARYISGARRNTLTQGGSSIPGGDNIDLICNTLNGPRLLYIWHSSSLFRALRPLESEALTTPTDYKRVTPETLFKPTSDIWHYNLELYTYVAACKCTTSLLIYIIHHAEGQTIIWIGYLTTHGGAPVKRT
jgi:hypothetical protein